MSPRSILFYSERIKNIIPIRELFKLLVLGIVLYSNKLYVAFELMIMLYLFLILLLKTNPKLDTLLSLLPLFLLL